jgi:hypothetical protein
MNKFNNLFFLAVAIMGVTILVGCKSSNNNNNDDQHNKEVLTINSTSPVDSKTDVPLNTTVSATFSEALDSSTINATNFTLSVGLNPVSGIVTYNDSSKTATFKPAVELANGTLYTASLSTSIKNADGKKNLASQKSWFFTTIDTTIVDTLVVDTVPLTVSSITPEDSSKQVAINSTIRIKFSEALDYSTVIPANYTVTAGPTPVMGTVTYDIPNQTAVFSPEENLTKGTLYTATATTDIKTLVGNKALVYNKVWTFTTDTSTIASAPVTLGTAGNFATLAKTGVSTVPPSVITGDVGLSPAAETFITGFSQVKATGYSTATQVTGYIYAADMTPPTPTNMTTAISDMEAAYTNAAGRTTPDFTDLGAGIIGGLTLTPGLYKWASNVTIPTNLTISGDANHIWIFQIDGDLTVNSAVNVTLSDGAKAKNIFWQVAGQVTMGTTSHMEGIVLSKTAITLNTGASINGRLLAQTQIALDQATVTQPSN